MKLFIKLIFREAWYHRSRILLAVLATTAMSAMLVWLIGSIDLVVKQFDNDAEHYLGYYQLAVIPQITSAPSQEENRPAPSAERELNSPLSAVPSQLFSDPLVLKVAAARQIRNTMAKYIDTESVLRRQRAGTGLPMGSPVIIGIDTDESPFELESGRWFNPHPVGVAADLDEMEGVIGTTAAKSLNVFGEVSDPVKVGDDVAVRIGEKEYKIKIVGMVEQKLGSSFGRGGITPAVGALYVSMDTAKHIAPSSRTASPPDYYYVRLKDGANVHRWITDYKNHSQPSTLQLQFVTASDIEKQLKQIRSNNPGALMGGAASQTAVMIFATLVSVLIVFTTLSMGVSERTRVFAMLRTAGMERRHIAALIFGESLILCVLGWLGGILAGWGVLNYEYQMMNHTADVKFVPLNLTAVMTAGVAAIIGSLLAAIIPAYRGAKIQPLEGMNRSYVHNVKRRWFYAAGFIGIILLIINPVCMYYGVSGETSIFRLALYSFFGLPTQLIGIVLLTPVIVFFTEWFFTPLVAKIFFVRKELLTNQLSSNLWRTIGTATALSVGLGVYSFLEISGYSMLVPFVHSQKLPDTLVTFLPNGLPYSEIDTVKHLPGVDSARFLPIALEQPLFSPEQAKQFQENGMSPMQASAGAVVFGLDIAKAFEKPFLPQGGTELSAPVVGVDFTEGTEEEAVRKLKTGGRYCIIPDSFAFRARLHIGDFVELTAERMNGRRGSKTAPQEENQTPRSPLRYEVAGIASVPGWLWMAKLSGVRKYGHRSGALLFAPYERVKEDFQIKDAAYFWFDRIGNVGDEELESSLQKLAEKSLSTVHFPPSTVSRSMVKVSSREYLSGSVSRRADDVIQAASRMPLILLAISSIGMMGTVAASIRTRQFEFGVLRSLGITRFGLIRLILAEAVLISIAAIIISAGFGTMGAWCFIGLMRYVSFFGGFVSPLTIPVYYLSLGFFVTIILCGLAAAVPAIIAGRKEPSDLLKI